MKSNRYKIKIWFREATLFPHRDIVIALYNNTESDNVVFTGRLEEDVFTIINIRLTHFNKLNDIINSRVLKEVVRVFYSVAGTIDIKGTDFNIYAEKVIANNVSWKRNRSPASSIIVEENLFFRLIEKNCKLYGKKEKIFGPQGTQSNI